MQKLILTLYLLIPIITFAQVPVHEEPLHHVRFEDDQIRLLDIIAQPSDTSELHQHPNNYFYIALQGSQVWDEVQGMEGREVFLKTGFMGGYYNTKEKPMTHRFSNLGKESLKIIAIENKSTLGNNSNIDFNTLDPQEVIIDNQFFCAFRVTIKGKKIQEISSPYPAIITSSENQSIKMRVGNKSASLKEVNIYENNLTGVMENKSKNDAEIIVVLVKN